MYSRGQTIFAVDTHRDGQRFIVRADEKLTALVELELAIRAVEPLQRTSLDSRLRLNYPDVLGIKR